VQVLNWTLIILGSHATSTQFTSTGNTNTSIGRLKEAPQEGKYFEDVTLSEPPDELAFLRGRVFESSQEPQMELEALGVGELTVELDDEGKAFLEIPSDEHNKATSWLTRHFTLWAKEKWGYATSTNTVKRNNSKTRLPEIASFWGYPRCEWKPEVGELDVKIGEVEPDVVIPSSWKNGWDYDEAAVNDIVSRPRPNEL